MNTEIITFTIVDPKPQPAVDPAPKSEWAKKFEQGWEEYVLEKTTEELQSEGESLNHYFEMCAENEEGISSKDGIRMDFITKELKRRGAPLWW